MELNDILNKMENEGWQIDSDFKDAYKPFLQYFLETVEEQCNIADVVGRSKQLCPKCKSLNIEIDYGLGELYCHDCEKIVGA